ncbi:MAG: hypothetical protein ACK413_02515, partial [Patescibacteria group bacterium]
MNQDFQFNICENCFGQGEKEGKICSVCLGSGLWAIFNGKDIFFDREISNLLLVIFKIKRILQTIIKVFLILFGILGFLSLIQTIFQIKILSEIFIFNQPKTYLMKIFWFSLLTDLFLIYLKNREKKDLDLISSFQKKEKINVNDFLDENSERVIKNSFLLAKKLNHLKIEPIHLFIGVLQTEAGAVVASRLGISWLNLKEKIAKILEKVEYNYTK